MLTWWKPSEYIHLTKSYKNRPANHLPKRVCPTASSPQAQKFEPLLPILPTKKCVKKNGSCKARVINVLFLENLEQLQKWAEKKSRELPLEGPSPCGKTGLAPWRQSTFSSCFVCSQFFPIYANFIFGPNLTKTDLQITSQSVSAQQLLPHRLKHLNPSYQSYPPKKALKKNGSCKVRLINVLFLENLEQLQKWAEKKSREFPLEGPSPCGKTGLAPCRQSILSSCFVWSPFFLISLFMFFLGTKPCKNRPPKSPPKACLPNSFFPTGSKIWTPFTNLTQKNVLKKMGVAKLGS